MADAYPIPGDAFLLNPDEPTVRSGKLFAGLHYDIPDAVYRADPTPERSLTQSAAKVLLTLTPAHYRYMRTPPTKKFDIGHIAHKMLLGRGREIIPLAYDSWRTNDSKAARAAAEAAGQLAVLEDDYQTGIDMAQAGRRQLTERGYGEEWIDVTDFTKHAEVVAIARVDGPIYEFMADGGPSLSPPVIGHHWLRAMIDWLPSLTRVWDYKTTGPSSCAAAIRTWLPDWCIQAAMHERILNLLDPDNAGRRQHRFVVQENFEPYALQVVRLTEAHLTIGRAQVARAEAIWAQCMATDTWPAYPLDDVSPDYPAWKMAAVMEETSDE
jgi:hypothetical protein